MRVEGLRAVVLAAGRGERLRPLTESQPKPLLPLRGRPILAHTLDQLAGLGCEEVAVNLHHLGEKVVEELGESYRGVRLVYSREEELLGTLGALGALRDFLEGAEEVLVVNGDSLCRWPFRVLLRRHRRRGPDATLLLSSVADTERFGGGVGVDRDGRIVDFGPGESASPDTLRRWVFAGAHVLSASLLREVEARPANFVPDLYRPLLESGGRLESVNSRRAWHDLGTPSRYLEGALAPPRSRWWRSEGAWVSPETRVEPGASIEGSVIEGGCEIGSGCRVVRSLVLPGARLGADCTVEDAIVDFGTLLLPGTAVRRRLVTPAIPGRAFPADTSHVGGLAYLLLDPPKEDR